ncbi:MAG: Flp family type IVb pilin [Bdellovibrionaceae bacterium]|nr:Flp family type IVb pilin [Pseudobdellovibrionaceae bacterium]
MKRIIRSHKMLRGQTLVEYALILALIALVVVTSIGLLGNHLLNAYNYVINAIGNATT